MEEETTMGRWLIEVRKRRGAKTARALRDVRWYAVRVKEVRLGKVRLDKAVRKKPISRTECYSEDSKQGIQARAGREEEY